MGMVFGYESPTHYTSSARVCATACQGEKASSVTANTHRENSSSHDSLAQDPYQSVLAYIWPSSACNSCRQLGTW